MTAVDLLRIVFFAIFGLGAAFMIATNFIAYKVLRPAQKMGFLWWHVTTISISFLCLGTVVLVKTYNRLQTHAPSDWTTYVTGLGVITFAIAQAIIFSVEKSRLTQRMAASNSSDEGHLVYDPSTEEGVIVPSEDDDVA